MKMRSLHWLSSGLALGIVVTSLTAIAASKDQLRLVGARATHGAAPGYVDDSVCAQCHSSVYESYQHVGMAQSLRRPETATQIETHGTEFFHEPLERYYQILRQGDQLTFRRYQRDTDGKAINEIELPVSWVIGSGNRARSYLYQTEWGEVYMLPLTWYSEEQRWDMSPGYEESDHPGIHRRVPRSCMFCHNAFPEVPQGSDVYWAPDKLPNTLPEGTGCQRCHGPGAKHIRTALTVPSVEEIRSTIVNPAELSGEIRDSICFQCHMLPSASVEGALRVGKGVYSYRPGQLLSDYLAHVDIEEAGEKSEQRFEINHHGYRFYQSECYNESDGAFSCISCHNPHEKPESSVFRNQVANVCTGCHQSLPQTPAHLEPSPECVTCHMPRRRTSDVIHVTMTDHRIASGPFDFAALVAPMEKPRREILAVNLLDFGEPPSGPDADIYKSLAAIRAGQGLEEAQQTLDRALRKSSLPVDELPFLDLAAAQLNTGNVEIAAKTAQMLVERGQHPQPANTILGVSLLVQGHLDEAITSLKRALAVGDHPEAHFSLGAAYARKGDFTRASEHFSTAIRLRPNMTEAWRYRARIARLSGDAELARDSLIRVLQLRPEDLTAYDELVGILQSLGEKTEANRYHALKGRMVELLADQ